MSRPLDLDERIMEWAATYGIMTISDVTSSNQALKRLIHDVVGEIMLSAFDHPDFKSGKMSGHDVLNMIDASAKELIGL